MATITIATPTEGQTVMVSDNGYVRIVLTENSLWDKGLSARAVILDSKGCEVWRREQSFKSDECAIALMWPSVPGDYRMQAQAVGMFDATRATVVTNFKVVAKGVM